MARLAHAPQPCGAGLLTLLQMPRSVVTTLGLSLCFSGLSALQAQDDGTQSTVPAMKVLPVGSSLHGVTVPRFDKDYQKTSLFEAYQVNILEQQRMRGFDVDLTFYTKVDFPTKIHLNTALYFETSGLVHSNQNLRIHAKQYDIAAQGLLLDSTERYGLLLGNTQSIFYTEPATEPATQPSAATPSNEPQQAPSSTKATHETMSPSAKKASLVAATVASTIPALLTAEELQEIDQLAQSSEAQIEVVDSQARSENADTLKQSNALDARKQDHQSTLVNATQQSTEVTQEPETLVARNNASTPVQINCDDGMYFDAFNGIAIYQKNVVVTHPIYKLTCSDELKLILQADDGTSYIKPNTENPDSMVTPETQNMSRFKQLHKAIAIGDVVINAVDSEGKPILAQAPIATYDATTGIVILKGNQSFVQQGDTIARILSNSGYIKLLPDMSVRMHGKHEVKTNLDELQD
ncbi:LptA/OstA family protein [Rubritalea marina]|uniref:LptA/OstA family protein n=1 Tax=Rubritalea marina TaxID=361055 RepID=UPI0003760F92|nr:LptA/OstA family protein [Rubritalea marina]